MLVVKKRSTMGVRSVCQPRQSQRRRWQTRQPAPPQTFSLFSVPDIKLFVVRASSIVQKTQTRKHSYAKCLLGGAYPFPRCTEDNPAEPPGENVVGVVGVFLLSKLCKKIAPPLRAVLNSTLK